MNAWRDWIGREEHRADLLTQGLIARYRATIDSSETGAIAPQGIHWCLCPPDAATSGLGPDGHPERGGFLPPIDLPRRMWASSEVEFLAPLTADARIERTSRVAFIDEKQGASGRLLFVTVQHETRSNGTLMIAETQTLVYRDSPAPAALPPLPSGDRPPPDGWLWQRSLTPTAPMLFRYSALTFNAHRIHYDLPYARDQEGYPGLVVHGPLTASLLLDLAARVLGPNRLTRFRFRGIAPAFSGVTLHLLGREDKGEATFAVSDGAGREIMSATGTVAR